MSTEVDPPERTSRSGRSCATAERSAFFFSPVGSHADLGLERSPLAEGREGDLRAAVLEDVAPGLRLPEPETTRLALDGGERARLLVLGQRVGVDPVDAVRGEPVVLGAAGGKQVEPGEHLGRGIRKPVDDLSRELRELSARDDRDVDPLGELDEQAADARIDRALRRGERVVEVEGDEPGRRHCVLLIVHAKGPTM